MVFIFYITNQSDLWQQNYLARSRIDLVAQQNAPSDWVITRTGINSRPISSSPIVNSIDSMTYRGFNKVLSDSDVARVLWESNMKRNVSNQNLWVGSCVLTLWSERCRRTRSIRSHLVIIKHSNTPHNRQVTSTIRTSWLNKTGVHNWTRVATCQGNKNVLQVRERSRNFGKWSGILAIWLITGNFVITIIFFLKMINLWFPYFLSAKFCLALLR